MSGNDTQNLETVESLKAQLMEAQDTFNRNLSECRAEKQQIELELSAVKQDCYRLSTMLDDTLVRANKAEETCQKSQEQMNVVEAASKERMEALRERQCDAPAIDEAVFKNYKDFRALLHERCGAEFMTVEEQWQFARSNPLSVLERTREWMLKATECFTIVMKQSDAMKNEFEQEREELIGALEMKMSMMGSSSAGGQHHHQLHQQHHHHPSTTPSASTPGNISSSGGSKQTPSSNKKQEHKQQSSSPSAEHFDSQEELFSRYNVLRRELAITKSELVRAHKQVHVAEQKQGNVQNMLEKAHRQLQEAIEASSSSTVRKQVDEIKKTMRAAISAKEEEIQSLKQIFQKEVVGLTNQIQTLTKRVGESDSIQAALTVQKQENAQLKSQLARMDVKSLQEHKKRADLELGELRAHTSNLESTVDTLRLRLSAAKQLASESKQKYSALFDAHLQEAKQRQIEQAKIKLKNIRREVVGSDSTLTKYHFEQKYQNLVAELAATQQKLKRLIMIAHHDQVAHDAEIEQMQGYALQYYERQQQQQLTLEQAGSRPVSPDYHKMDASQFLPGGGVSPIIGGGGDSAGKYSASASAAAHRRQNLHQTLANVAGAGHQTSVDRNLFSAHGAIREQLQHNVVVSNSKAVVEEIANVVGEGKVQDSRTWDQKSQQQQQQQQAGFEVSSRTASAAVVAKQKSDMNQYYEERDRREQLREAQKKSLSTKQQHQKSSSASNTHSTLNIGGLTGGSIQNAQQGMTPSRNQMKPPRSVSSNSQTPPPSAGSVQFFVEGSSSPVGTRNKRVL